MASISIIIPAYNEAGAVGATVRKVQEVFQDSGHTFEVLVVDDGSRDATGPEAEFAGARVVRHPVNLGYGYALMSGISRARYPLIGITDADGTYPIEELPAMTEEVAKRGLDMLVGARRGAQYQGSPAKRIARWFFKFLAEFACGRTIPDINSGLRVMRRDMLVQFAGVLCGGFSFTTTITIIAILTGRFVDYRPIAYAQRIGKSHVRYFRDTLRAMQIIVMTIILFNPMKFFLLFALGVGAAGLPLVLLAALVPRTSGWVLILTLFILGMSLLGSIGFLAEQRRAIFVGPRQHRARTPRKGRKVRAHSSGGASGPGEVKSPHFPVKPR
ncbi:MAG: glycosyltransferase family 2 protein [Planctomycetes bacterium]|nr:glycosyltransferase family 2 protein [Planctomycetota bacterium]